MQLPTLHDSPLNEISTMLPSLNEENNKLYPVRSIVNPLTNTVAQRKKKKTAELKTLLHKQKSQLMVKQFVVKMKRLVPSSKVPPSIPVDTSNKQSIFDIVNAKLINTPGLKLSILWNIILSVLTLLQSLCSVFVISAYLVFPEMHHESQVSILNYTCIAVGIFDMILMCFLERFQSTVDMKNLQQIIIYNLREDFKVDALSVLALIIAPFCQTMPISFILVAISLKKLLKSLARTEKLQNFYLTNILYQKYYTIMKVTFFNFIIGHAIATLLLLMCNIYPQQNWIIKNGLAHEVWYIKYIWGYYWGVNIMLTVGFGDITATTYHQAFLLIFIETVSCIMLAYNINTVGSILAQIKAKDSTRKKQLRVIYKISQENRLATELKKEIMNSINQSYEIKQKFLYDDYDEILQSLPADVRPVYKRQSNKFLFDGLPFVNILSKKSIMNLSERIVRKISHPQQIIIKKGDICEFTIFYRGHLQYLCSSKGTKIDGVVTRQFSIKQNEQSKLINLNFFRLDTYKYDIKSKGYSVLYFINQEQLVECLRQMKRDFQIYCEYKDKDSLFLASKQVHFCDNCPGEKHDIFDCPKTRYLPLKEFILIKQFGKMKKKQLRSPIHRRKYKIKCLKKITEIQVDHNSFSQCHSYQKLDGPQKKSSSPAFLNILQATIKKSTKVIKASDTNKSLNLSKTYGNECSVTNELTMSEIDKIKQALCLSVHDPQNYRGFWSLEADQCHDFAYYMKNHNPKYLKKNA